jgi:hypothetical protein
MILETLKRGSKSYFGGRQRVTDGSLGIERNIVDRGQQSISERS